MSDTGTWHLAPSTNTLGSDLMGPSCTSVNLSCLRELQFQVFRLYCQLQTESVSSIRSGHSTSGLQQVAKILRRVTSTKLQVLIFFQVSSVPLQVGTSKRRSARLQRGAQGYFFGITTCQRCSLDSLVGSKHRCIANLPKSSLLLPHLQVLVTFHCSVTLRTKEIRPVQEMTWFRLMSLKRRHQIASSIRQSYRRIPQPGIIIRYLIYRYRCI